VSHLRLRGAKEGEGKLILERYYRARSLVCTDFQRKGSKDSRPCAFMEHGCLVSRGRTPSSAYYLNEDLTCSAETVGSLSRCKLFIQKILYCGSYLAIY